MRAFLMLILQQLHQKVNFVIKKRLLVSLTLLTLSSP
jgi:hypothetical protein